MAEIKVTPAEVLKKSEELKNLNQQFKSKADEMSGMEQNLASMWEGDAQKAFRDSFNKDKIQWSNFNTLINQYCLTLDNIAREYMAKEQMNVEIARGRNY